MHELDSAMLILAQQTPPPPGAGAVPPPPGGEQPLTGATSGAGGPGTAAPARDPLGGIFMPLMLVVVAMFVFTMLGQRRERKKKKTLLDSIKKHDRVQTSGGVIGAIVEVKSDTIILKVDESSNTRITFARSAIQQVLSAAADVDKIEPPAAAG